MKNLKRIWILSIAILAWFALALQLWLMLTGPASRTFSVLATTSNFLSYFTILSNLLVAICLTLIFLIPSSKPGKFFSKIPVQSAIALYIFIVGLVYNLVLRNLWKPEGWQLVADNLLHLIIPLLYIIFWMIYIPKRTLQWINILPWLIFPVIYLAYSLVRGVLTGWYPYPFINADQLGYGKVIVNSLLVLVAFLITGALIIGFNRISKKIVE